MAVDEPRRIELFERLSAIVGAEATHTLFALFPPPGQDAATRGDVTQVGHELGVLRQEVGVVREEVGVVRRDVDGLRVQIIELEARVNTSHHELTATIHQEITRALVVQTRTTVFSMVTALAAISALALGLG